MQHGQFKRCPARLLFVVLLWTILAERVCAQTTAPADTNLTVRVVMEAGEAEVLRGGSANWQNAGKETVLHPGDRLRIPRRSRGVLIGPGQQRTRLSELAEVQIRPNLSARRSSVIFNLVKGILYFLQREQAEDVLFETPFAGAAIRGTEFALQVTEGETVLTVIDGAVELSNAQGHQTFRTGQQAIARSGQAPAATAALPLLNDVIQWCFYYPAVVNPDELDLPPDAQRTLGISLAAYRSGDLLGALRNYPDGREPASAAERVYLAQLYLSVGKVEDAERLISGQEFRQRASERAARIAKALGELIATVKVQSERTSPIGETNALSSELLANSYYWQAVAKPDRANRNLERARQSAQAAVKRAPDFGYAWERLAEMQFTFGQTGDALEALARSLELAPNNAQALALKGFVLAGQNRFEPALASFEQAIKLDPALGNGWLGRGLCRIHEGHSQAGREDLLVAATVEPQRAVLRSYLGKAYADNGDVPRAERELGLAKRFDPHDPTAWLYSALFNQQENRINDAIRDLEKSQDLNDNRSVYRSRLLLEQDRAVRSANLANIFRDNNMTDVSLREASLAVNADYANYSAHLFLANSYDLMRDPNFVNLRLETAANSEYLIANLLAPVGGGILNQQISQQEYSRLFEQNRLGVVSDTEYLSRGAWIENGAQYGIFDTTSYSIGAFYRTDRGQRPNEDVEQRQLLLQVKQQLTPQDTVYLEASQLEINAGDLVQYYDNVSPYPGLRVQETQEPILTLGYHHEWGPGQHTVLLGSWVNDEFESTVPRLPTAILFYGPFPSARSVHLDTDYRARVDLFSVEPQQIWQQDRNTAIVGGRYQSGDFRLKNVQSNPDAFDRFFANPAVSQDFKAPYERFSIYGYDQFEIAPSLWLTAGVVYDRITFPENPFAPPFSDRSTTEDQVSPKAGLIWTAPIGTTLRFAYGRSLTGASLDQSVRIEPTQVAGINQAFRSLIPESLEGPIPGAHIETYAVSVEQKFASGTYLGLSGQIGDSEADQEVGGYSVTSPPFVPGQPPPPLPTAVPIGIAKHLNYGEKLARITVDQLLGRNWSVGARYQVSYVELNTVFPEIAALPTSAIESAQALDGVFHQVGLVAAFNHPSGVFSQLEADWYSQSNHGYTPAHAGDEFWQVNLFAGYRFLHRRAEVAVGLLNLNDADYHLDPITFYSELPRSRTLAARFRFSF